MDYQVHITNIKGHTFHLHPLKAIFWEEQGALLIADLHLGKTRHFRREGFPVPQGAGDANYDKLINLFLHFEPKRVIYLGDLFHSDYNQEWEELIDLMARFPNIQFELVVGNHDRLSGHAYQKAGLNVYESTLQIENILLTHEPLESIPEGVYNLAGHIHPCVRLRGLARQSLRLACFYFGLHGGLLPAFGAFTGMANIEVEDGAQVFVLSEEKVIPV